MAYAAGWLLDVYIFISLSLNNLCPLFTYIRVSNLADPGCDYYRQNYKFER